MNLKFSKLKHFSRMASRWLGLFSLTVALIYLQGVATTPLLIRPGDWISSQIGAEILSQLLQSHLSIDTIVENPQDLKPEPGFIALSDGSLDLLYESWPIGSHLMYDIYVDTNLVIPSDIGFTGSQGWFFPSYMIEDWPLLPSWKALKDPTLIAAISTTETFPNGTLIEGPSSWKNFDNQIIESLQLNLELVYSTDENTLVDTITTLYDTKKPFLFQFFAPHSLWSGPRQFLELSLPEFSEYPSCEILYRFDNGRGVGTCLYPLNFVQKLISPTLSQRSPNAFILFERFRLSEDDINLLCAEVFSSNKTIEQAASDWITSNPSIWQPWLPVSSSTFGLNISIFLVSLIGLIPLI